jgi:hypothetical protein
MVAPPIAHDLGTAMNQVATIEAAVITDPTIEFAAFAADARRFTVPDADDAIAYLRSATGYRRVELAGPGP